MDPIEKSAFTANLLALNRTAVSGFGKWLFKPGMAYGERRKWWDNRTLRPKGHEGVDLASYLDREGRECRLGSGIIVPPLHPGRLAGTIADFMGRTVIVKHEITNRRGLVLFGFYAHLLPAGDLETGKLLPATGGLGKIAPGNESCPAHLHISTAWLASGYPIEQFDWSRFEESKAFVPCNPVDFLPLADHHL
ncbi:MAG: hypothetical protein LC633_09595 [Desulfobulbaceae bacterium]|nr:hypothetical protein [Desulfobulbaceae bacterium]